MIKTIAIDLDGVLNTYCGNLKETEIAPQRNHITNVAPLPAPSLMTELSGLTAITTKPYKKLLFLSHIGANFSNTLLILIF